MSLNADLHRGGEMRKLKWDEFSAREAADRPGCIREIVQRQRDGITVTDVVTPEEIERGFAGLVGVERIETNFGSLLGMSLGMIGPQEPDRSRYYQDTVRCRAIFDEAFGFDLHERIATVLAPMADGMPMVPPHEDGNRYEPGQIRWWEPGRGGLPAHAGNEFGRALKDGAMSHLMSVAQVTHHLSYFLVLQKADVGGALSVYDLLWEEFDGADQPWEDCTRDDAMFDGVPCTPINPEAGGLVVFGGGWRWHRVDPVLGTKARITYGGFCAPSVDETEINFWT